MKILMVASEGVPFSKTGGLADVIYSLSKEVALGHEVSIVYLFMAVNLSVNMNLNSLRLFLSL